MTRTLSSALMITGTCVGAGMLALPIAGAEIGLLPSLFVMIVAWAFMTTTGLFYMEAARWFEQGAHLGQMTQALLGRGGRFTASFIYLFIAYASLVAYQVEGGKVMLASLSIEGLTISKHFIEVCLFAALFSCVLVLGANFIKRLNSILVILMCTLYIAILYFTLPYFDPSLALRQNWDIKAICQFFPLMLTSFSFPGIVPALVLPLGGDVKKMRLAILLGTTSAFLFYATWMAAVMGCVELDGNWGLRAARLNDRGASAVLMHLVGQPLLKYAAQAFSFMAIATSFLGISWGLIYFFADALKWGISGKQKGWLIALVSIPAVVCALLFETIFFTALELSGGIGDAVVSGIIPALLIWVGVYRRGYKHSKSFLLSRGILLVIVTLAASMLGFELFSLVNH